MFDLKAGEQLDDLQIQNKKIIQNPKDYCFTSDSVLLANISKLKKSETLCDLCSGSGIIPSLIFLKQPFKKAYLVEINKEAADRAKRSAVGNGFDNFEVIDKSIQDCLQYIEEQSVDVVTCNPPYMEQSIGMCEENENIAIARREIKLCLEDIVKVTSKLLKYGGRFYMIHSSNRLVDCLFFLRKYGLEPKNIQYVHPKQNMPSNVFLIECKKGGKKGLNILPPHYVR